MDPASDQTGIQKTSIVGPLSFPEPEKPWFLEDEDIPTACMLCEKLFCLQQQEDNFLKHLFHEHRLVIADVQLVASLKSYVEYWRARLKSEALAEFCSTMVMDVLPDGTPSTGENYFLLSDVLPEDRLLREGLQQKRLGQVLAVQQWEREDRSFSRGCLFCRQHFEGCRADLFNHLAHQHNLHLGRPDNLVFADRLLDLLDEKLCKLQCLFCEKLFKDRAVLKEHMRKKQHKKINPANTEYDKFYIINYLELGKNWQDVQNELEESEPTGFSSEEEDSRDWSDWCEEEPGAVCLFCEHGAATMESIYHHMRTEHGFDFEKLRETLGLDFYHQVKLVNYIRRQIYQGNCIVCSEGFSSRQGLLKHMTDRKHFVVPGQDVWDQPQYYFPTYENDKFLCHLEDTSDDESSSRDGSTVAKEQVKRAVLGSHEEL